MHGHLPRLRKVFRRSYQLRPRTIRAFAFAFVGLVILSFVGAEGWSVWQAREDRLDNARLTTMNMTRALVQQANDTIQAADIALVGVVDVLENDGMDAAAKPNFKILLQRTAIRFPALNSVSIYDSQGQGIATSRTVITGRFAIPDREYFRYHVTHRETTAHVGAPVRSVTSGKWILPVSRRINRPDGSFAGIAVATIDVDYFAQYQNSFDIGWNGAILLMMDNGTVIVRRPYDPALIGADLSKGVVYRAFLGNGERGSAVLTGVVDGKKRMYSYQRLPDYPVIVSSALAVDDVLAHWREDKQRTTAIEAVVLAVLCVVGYRLIRLIDEREQAQEELRQAKGALEVMNKSLERLSLQDSLTGLGNRRLFDTALAEEFARAVRGGTPLALLLIDVDYFKRYNDHYGHLAGDVCLRQIGETLMRTGSRPGDVAVRYGGEELAVLLPETDEAGAIAMGERFRIAIHSLELLHAGSPVGIVTVSVGASACVPGLDSSSAESLIQATDKALYVAKESGRNQVRGATHPT
ncbi:GGDEF domain-containing protein [Noviherbaspirillum sp. DKR-6]|uniref:diguanylate cyclase n=2 Tax=Noviherbaspirillum pedocola TaxID=2801341 RepID=A0A934T0N7_9BURK|nr:GGDEF domain-containing protein [Noviherbaspirillum pedocola]